MSTRIETLPAIRIDCPEWYERADFQEFLNLPANCLATWHRPGNSPNECSDVFMLYDHDEGSDYEAIPEDIWEEICRLCKDNGLSYGIVWISNVGE